MSAQSEATNAEIEKHKESLEDEWEQEMSAIKDILRKTLSTDTISKVMMDLESADNEDVLELDSKIALGIDPEDTGDPYKAGCYSFFMFSIGGFIPLLPYFSHSH